ncbi:MAG: alpha/beta hydrolase [Porphyrobacter sp.]|nr:alpha/beta hydrolase [Porphyrobacter sp.]
METPRFHALPDGRRLAYRLAQGRGPALVFLPGYLSDMSGTKATALAGWAAQQGRACLLFDYSGCGQSPGSLAEGTPSRWAAEAAALIEALVPGPAILIGSSMGGWLMLLAGRTLGPRLAGLVGIAAAPDFTDWGYSEAEVARLAAGEMVLRPNPYGAEPTPTHPGFWRDGQAHRLLGAPIALDCPVRLLHGQADEEVPVEVSLRLAERLTSADVQVTLVKGGDHRLSRPGDIALLLRTIAALAGEG